jgi:hypothetical protein
MGKNMKKKSKKDQRLVTIIAIAVIVIVAVLIFLTTTYKKGGSTGDSTSSSKSAGGGQSSGAVKTVNSPEALKEYLDSQSSSSPDKPLKVKISVNDLMVKSVADAIKSTGKYVSLDLTDSPLKTISIRAFSGCSTLTTIIIPDNVTSIGMYAFNDCTSLSSVTIGSGVTSIGNGAFSGCTKLSTINVATDNTSYSSQGGILYNKNKTELVAYPAAKKGAFTVPNSVTRIWGYSFSGCIGLTGIIIGNNVTSIMEGTFNGCSNLTSVDIGSRVTSIEKDAFRGCTSIDSVMFASLISSDKFHNEAFSGPARNLRDKYIAASGGRGTYKRASGSSTWTKQ